jgi:hypothetical protein
MTDLMDRLEAKAAERAKIVDQIAGILWRNGEELAETEGGSMPTWEEVVARRCDCVNDVHWAYWLDHTHRAEALLSLAAPDALLLAKLLIDSALSTQNQMELDLWRKIEHAKGFEAGSLTGKPGVRSRLHCDLPPPRRHAPSPIPMHFPAGFRAQTLRPRSGARPRPDRSADPASDPVVLAVSAADAGGTGAVAGCGVGFGCGVEFEAGG